MVWSVLGCFGKGESTPALEATVEPTVILADAGLIFGQDSADSTMTGWRLTDKGVERFQPTGPGSIVAAATTQDGVVAVAAQQNGASPQLWWSTSEGWTEGEPIAHGPINQLLASPDGALWTEGDGGVYRTADEGKNWTRMDIPADLHLGASKLGEHEGRVVFAGRTLVASTDNGTSWTTLYDGKVSTTDGVWVAEQTSKPSLRIGRIGTDGVEWTGEIEGAWVAASIAGSATAVRVVATKQLSTEVVLLSGDPHGKGLSVSRVYRSQPEWVGLGEKVLWMDIKRRLHTDP